MHSVPSALPQANAFPFLRIFWELQVCILDGNRYNKMCREAGEQRLDILDECEVRLVVYPADESSYTL